MLRITTLCLSLATLASCGDDAVSAPDATPLDGAMDAADADATLADAEADGSLDVGVEDAGPPWTGPERLSETGLFADLASRTLADGVRVFEPRWPLWSDGSDKTRYLLLPPGTTIDTRDPDGWVFPVGTRAWKDFRRDGVLVETRMIEKLEEGRFGWRYVAYVWDAGETDAVATPDGLVDALGTPHDVPSQSDCRNCHRGGSDFLLGVGALQLAGGSGFLSTLEAEGLLTDPIVGGLDPPGPPEVADALGYLHANCGHCHNERHPVADMRTLRLWLPVGVATVEETPAYLTAIGARANHDIEGTTVIVVAGMPDLSQLYVRMGDVDPDLRMPQVGRELVDPDGRAAIRAWIESL